MYYSSKYNSKVGLITLICDGEYLTNLYIENQKYKLKTCIENNNLQIFKDTKKWLDKYFNGDIPTINIKIKLEGTPFQKEVWNILTKIPYGKTITYKDIGLTIFNNRDKNKIPYQAIGQAVGKNPISIIIPCHRVIGSNGNLTGYNGGIEIKEKLLKIENIDI